MRGPRPRQSLTRPDPDPGRDSWKERGACAVLGADPKIFYDPSRADLRKAMAYCALCPVREECLLDAIEMRDDFGIRGGLTPAMRRAQRRENCQTPVVA